MHGEGTPLSSSCAPHRVDREEGGKEKGCIPLDEIRKWDVGLPQTNTPNGARRRLASAVMVKMPKLPAQQLAKTRPFPGLTETQRAWAGSRFRLPRSRPPPPSPPAGYPAGSLRRGLAGTAARQRRRPRGLPCPRPALSAAGHCLLWDCHLLAPGGKARGPATALCLGQREKTPRPGSRGAGREGVYDHRVVWVGSDRQRSLSATPRVLGWQSDPPALWALTSPQAALPSGECPLTSPWPACSCILAPGLLLLFFYLPGASHLPGLPRTIGAGSN